MQTTTIATPPSGWQGEELTGAHLKQVVAVEGILATNGFKARFVYWRRAT